jgi:hypothetical protein
VRRLFEAAGVDYVQWRALTRAYVQLDYAALLGAYGAAERLRALRALLITFVFLSMMGAGGAAVAFAATDVLFAATAVTTMIGMIVGMIVLGQTSMIIAPEDYLIIGFRPVSSRTYFALRATAVLLSTFEAVALCGFLPVLAFLLRSNGSFAVALSAAAAIGAAALWITFALIALYGWLVRAVSPGALSRVVGFAQVMAVLAIMGSYLGVWMYLGERGISDRSFTIDVTLPRSAWTLAYPGTWFGSYISLASGTAGRFDLAAAALSVASLVALGAALRGRLSADYAVRITQLTIDATVPTPGQAANTWSFLSHERRAVAMLTVSQLKGDVPFQISVVMTVFMALFFAAVSFLVELPPDPFQSSNTGVETALLAQLAVFFLPASGYDSFASSQAHQASWLFFTTPADRARLVTAARDMTALFMLAPTMVVLAVFFIYAFGHVGHALLHVVMLGGLAYIALQIVVLLRPKLPFSLPPAQAQGNRRVNFGVGIVGGTVGLVAFSLLPAVVYKSTGRIVAAMAVIGATAVVLNRLTRAHLEHRTRALTRWSSDRTARFRAPARLRASCLQARFRPSRYGGRRRGASPWLVAKLPLGDEQRRAGTA